MKKKYGFTLLTLAEFESWIKEQDVARTIFFIQEHHTFSPNYLHFKGDNHFELQKSMQNYHTVVNGWQDIGQHFSIFPDGMIVTGRSLEISPACIFGFNSNSICIENVGNFDIGGDTMRPEHKEAIVRVTAALCKRFRVPADAGRVVYHHWFDLNTGNRTDGSGVTKSCPGTNFFGGNTVEAAKKNFYPLVQKAIDGVIPPPMTAMLYYAYVNTKSAAIRRKPNILGKKINTTPFGSVLRVYEEKGNWLRISAGKDEWVAARSLTRVQHGVVNTDDLNVRFGPGVEFNPPIGSVNKGQIVIIFAQSGNWLRIGLDERWVAKKFVDIAA